MTRGDHRGMTRRLCLLALTTFAIAAQQSSLFLVLTLLPCLIALNPRAWRVLVLPPAIAITALIAVNLAGHGRAAISPFGNVFLLARVIYDGPGLAVLQRDCPASGWRLCPWRDQLPPTSDDFLWQPNSPIILSGGHKVISAEAGAIISAALWQAPGLEARAALANAAEQLTRFDSGDGLEPWPQQVTTWIERDFPAWESATYAASRQARGLLAIPPWLGQLHRAVAITGILASLVLLPLTTRRHAAAAKLLLVVLIALPLSAAITGGLSTPHDRYQSRIIWLPAWVAFLSAGALAARRA